MQRKFRFVVAPLAVLLTAGATGCTLFPDKNPPTLATTTSAEQHDRILWQMAQKQQWSKIPQLFSTTLVWQADGKSLSGDQVVPYLQSLNLKDAVVRDASVRPNGSDMTVAYTLELASEGKGPASGSVSGYSALSVWQQTKGGGWILIAHSQQANAAAASSATR